MFGIAFIDTLTRGEDMKFSNHNLLKDKELLKDVLRQVDVLNTVNGGTAMTSVDVIGEADSIVIKVSAPTIPVDAFNILLSYDKLTVSIFSKQDESVVDETPMVFPMFMRTFDIPAFVDLDRIEAVHEGNELNVILPIKNASDSLHRLIDIKEL